MSLVGLRPAAHTGPAYLQIADALEVFIRRHHKEGEPLPSEQTLADRFGVNKHTLRRSVDQLVMNGLVERRRGIGLFVLDPAISYRIEETTRFTARIEELGRTAATQVLTKQLIRAGDTIGQRLAITPGEDVIAIETLRLVDNRPFCLISHFLAAEPFRSLVENYDSGSLHEIIEREFSLKLKRSESLITAIMPHGDDAKLLRIGCQQPVLRVKSVNRNAVNNAPVEYAVTRFRGDLVELSVGLRKRDGIR